MSEREEQTEWRKGGERPDHLTWEAVLDHLDSAFDRMEEKMSNQFDTLHSDVQALTASEGQLKTAVTAALGDIASQIADLKAKLAAAGVPADLSADLSAIEAATADLTSQVSAVSAADPGATPAPAPAPAPVPAPAPADGGTPSSTPSSGMPS